MPSLDNVQNIVACVPDGAPGYTPGCDYERVNCPRCRRRCWLGPKAKAKVAAGEAILLCAHCAIRLTRADRSSRRRSIRRPRRGSTKRNATGKCRP
ncbi:MAG TPA: hypothetical protein VK797_23410 [Tepidisphaeraceae bacterium]|jgi:hypothetical protein|nr:hypothetical protein [Tepidisphaeraceae bacterium]